MKNLKSLSAVVVLSLCSDISANSLAEALSDGKASGEVAATYEMRKQDKELSLWNNYYSNTNYAVGSVALKYETLEWKNITSTIKFRGYKTLFEGGDDEMHYTGYGDSAERFYKNGKNRNVDFEEIFLKYNINSFSVIAGRQFISTDWINKTHDAIRVGASFGDTTLDAIYSYKHGRVYARDYRPLVETNDNDGVYKADLTHKINEYISASVYDFTAPNIRDIYGAKINLKFAESSLRVHYAFNKDKKDSSKDSSLIDIMLSTTYNGFTPYIGFVGIDSDARFNYMAGEIVIPFEEGDQMYLKGAKTYYAGLNKSFGDFSVGVLYGITTYDESNDLSRKAGNFRKDEFNLWLGYLITKNLNANLGYAMTNEDKDDLATTDLQQVNLTFTYKF